MRVVMAKEEEVPVYLSLLLLDLSLMTWFKIPKRTV